MANGLTVTKWWTRNVREGEYFLEYNVVGADMYGTKSATFPVRIEPENFRVGMSEEEFLEDITRVFNRKKGIEALKNNLIAAVQEQEDPTKRKVRSFTQVKNKDGLWEVTVISDFDGWAEDEKVLFMTIKMETQRLK